MSDIRSESGLIDVLDRVLDKGIVIDAHVRLSLAGVELVSVQARVVVASIQTYLIHADALAHTSLAAQPLTAEQTRPTQTLTAGPAVPTPLLTAEETEPTPPLLAEPVDTATAAAGESAEAATPLDPDSPVDPDAPPGGS